MKSQLPLKVYYYILQLAFDICLFSIQGYKELHATTKQAFKQCAQETSPPVVKPRPRAATSAASFRTRIRTGKDSGMTERAAVEASDLKRVEQIMYNEPIIHRSNTVSESPPVPTKLPRKRREIPLPPPSEQSSPRRQCPPLPVRPRPRVAVQQASQSPLMPGIFQQYRHGILDLSGKVEKTQPKQKNEGSDFFPRPLRPRSRSSQNVTEWDSEAEEPIKRSQSLDLDSMPSSNGEENTTAMTGEGALPCSWSMRYQCSWAINGCVI